MNADAQIADIQSILETERKLKSDVSAELANEQRTVEHLKAMMIEKTSDLEERMRRAYNEKLVFMETQLVNERQFSV